MRLIHDIVLVKSEKQGPSHFMHQCLLITMVLSVGLIVRLSICTSLTLTFLLLCALIFNMVIDEL